MHLASKTLYASQDLSHVTTFVQVNSLEKIVAWNTVIFAEVEEGLDVFHLD